MATCTRLVCGHPFLAFSWPTSSAGVGVAPVCWGVRNPWAKLSVDVTVHIYMCVYIDIVTLNDTLHIS